MLTGDDAHVALLKKDDDAGKEGGGQGGAASAAARACRLLTIVVAAAVVADIGGQLLLPSLASMVAAPSAGGAAVSASAGPASPAAAAAARAAGPGYDALLSRALAEAYPAGGAAARGAALAAPGGGWGADEWALAAAGGAALDAPPGAAAALGRPSAPGVAAAPWSAMHLPPPGFAAAAASAAAHAVAQPPGRNASASASSLSPPPAPSLAAAAAAARAGARAGGGGAAPPTPAADRLAAFGLVATMELTRAAAGAAVRSNGSVVLVLRLKVLPAASAAFGARPEATGGAASSASDAAAPAAAPEAAALELSVAHVAAGGPGCSGAAGAVSGAAATAPPAASAGAPPPAPGCALVWSAPVRLLPLSSPGGALEGGRWAEARLPLGGGAPTGLRLRHAACDGWGHSLGDPDCDPATPPGGLEVRLLSADALPATPAEVAASLAPGRLCAPGGPLAAGPGLPCALPDVCPLPSLYAGLWAPRAVGAGGGGWAGGGAATRGDGGWGWGGDGGAAAAGEPLLPRAGLEGDAQGLRCAEVMANTLARGWSTHKAVYRATFYPPGGGPPVAAVVKEGGLRWPPPAPGERGVGFAPAAPPSRQRLAAEAMFLEQAQEALLTELLGSDSDDGDGDDDGDDGGGATQPRRPPPVPRQLGACLSASYLLATSVTARARPLRGGADWAGLAAGAAPATAAGRAAAALGLARAAASLFRTLAEVRHLRLDDLHWDAYGADGRVRTNFSGFGGNAYPQDDLSQFGVSPAPCAAPLGCWALQLLDADKVAVSHDAELRWYVAESLSPFVAARLVAPLVPFLPALAHAAARLAHPDVLQRPPSFACLERWLSLPPRGDSRAGGGGSGSGGASAAAPPDGPPASSPSLAWLVDPDARAWRSLDEACDPKVHNEGLTSRWVEGAGGKA